MIALADHDYATRSASGFMIRYILPRTAPVHLLGALDRKGLFTKLSFGDLLVAVGHGSPSELCGQHLEVIMDAWDIPAVRGKVVKLISCETAQVLGPSLVAEGAAGYQGFREDLVWVIDADFVSSPWADGMAAKVMMPIVQAINCLLDGESNGWAFLVEQQALTDNIAEETDELVKACLMFNRSNAVLLGNPEARVRARPPLPLPFKFIPPPPMPRVLWGLRR